MSADPDLPQLYTRLIEAWNRRDAEAFAACFADDGECLGFDGSEMHGRAAIATELARIFRDHPTGRYLCKLRGVRPLGDEVALLRAVAGMVPAGKSELEPRLNVQQSLVAVRAEWGWRIALYQNTPAQLHGRPDLVERMTDELKALLRANPG